LIPPNQWSVYRRLLQHAIAWRIPFALGGTFATATHTGYWRDTADMDLYVLPADRERVIELTQQIGLRDVYDRYPYDRNWTYIARAMGTSSWKRSGQCEIIGLR
jgi:hypothetical protein